MFLKLHIAGKNKLLEVYDIKSVTYNELKCELNIIWRHVTVEALEK